MRCIHVLSAHVRALQILVVAKTMACQALEQTLFIYDQKLEQEMDMDTLNFQLEAELEANTEVEEDVEVILDIQEDDTVGT